MNDTGMPNAASATQSSPGDFRSKFSGKLSTTNLAWAESASIDDRVPREERLYAAYAVAKAHLAAGMTMAEASRRLKGAPWLKREMILEIVAVTGFIPVDPTKGRSTFMIDFSTGGADRPLLYLVTSISMTREQLLEGLQGRSSDKNAKIVDVGFFDDSFPKGI